jgi:UDP-hydrolysing UDP-N-acetyl-D-glucosamine 2-epimerase
MKRKVCAVVTARPSYSRIKTALDAIKKHKDLELQLVVAASSLLDKYGNVVKQMENDGFKITTKVYNVIEGETLITSAKTTGLGIIELSSVFAEIKPDVVLTIADRYETMATAIAAAYMNIPLAHIQGGEVTGNIDEKVRHAITKLADIHLVASEAAKQRVIRMGEIEKKVFITGCPSIDIADMIVKSSGNVKFDPTQKYHGVGKLLNNREIYLIVMQHPVTTEQGMEVEQIIQTYEAIKDIPIQCYWFWPNIDAGSDMVSKQLRIIRENDAPKNIYFFKNLSPEDFIILLNGAKCIVGNSSVAIREASYLAIPAINIGTRQSGRERGNNVIDVDYDKSQIYFAIDKVLKGNIKVSRDYIYGNGNAGKNIANILAEVELTYMKILQY